MQEPDRGHEVFGAPVLGASLQRYRREGRAAPELLSLAAALAALQVELHAELTDAPPPQDASPTPPADWAADALRRTADVVAAHSPQSVPALAGFAAGAAKLETGLLAAAARGEAPAVAEVAGVTGAAPAVAVYVLRAALQPHLAWRFGAGSACAGDLPFPVRQYCPACGGRPLMGKHTEPDGHRFLRCTLCGHEWAYPRMACPACGESEQAKLESFFVTGDEGHRAYLCATCKRYTKVSDERLLGGRVYLPLEDMVTLHLDDLARERGYTPVSEDGPDDPEQGRKVSQWGER
ncbi:MAG: formate dehydrogenase accessory protein FdhE [Bacillota bacterium]|nr:formate dehydrogenase accessory protein FdhE [Bacillota bacterium]